MKKSTSLIFSLALLTIITTIFSACDKLDEADDISFDVEFNDSFEVDEDADEENVLYTDVITLDATSNDKVKTYASKIKAVKVNRVVYGITGYTASGGAVLLNNAQMSFAAIGAAPSVVATVGTLNLQTAGTSNDLDIDQENLDKISTMILDDLQVVITVSGTLSDTPVTFNVPVTFYVTITANAL